MSYQNYTHATVAHVPVLYIEIALIGVLLFSYVGLAFHTVYAAGMKERHERALDDLASSVGNIEANYLALTKQIDIERAYALGFRENTEDTIFLNTSGKITAALP